MPSKFDQVLGKAKDFLANNKEMLIGGLGGGLLGGGATYMLSDADKDAPPSDLLSKRLKKALFGALLGGAAGTGAGYVYKNIPWDKVLKKVTEALDGPKQPAPEDKSYKAQTVLGAAGGVAGHMASNKISGNIAQDASDRQVGKASKKLMEKQLAADALNEKYKFNTTPGIEDLLRRIDIAEGVESKIPAIKDLQGLLSEAELRRQIGIPFADREIDAIKAKMSELTKQQLKIDKNILNSRDAMAEYAPILKQLTLAERQYQHISRTGGKGKYRAIKSIIDLLLSGGGAALGWSAGDTLQNELKSTNK